MYSWQHLVHLYQMDYRWRRHRGPFSVEYKNSQNSIDYFSLSTDAYCIVKYMRFSFLKVEIVNYLAMPSYLECICGTELIKKERGGVQVPCRGGARRFLGRPHPANHLPSGCSHRSPFKSTHRTASRTQCNNK